MAIDAGTAVAPTRAAASPPIAANPPRPRSGAALRLPLTLIIVGALAAPGAFLLAGRGAPAASAPPLERGRIYGLNGVVAWRGDLTLKERDDVINVSPLVQLEPDGGYLIADSREAQIRRYTGGGELLAHFGQPGSGPGEFNRLAVALRTGSSEILAVDMGGRLTLFGEAGEVLRTQQTPVAPIFSAKLLPDAPVVALTGRLDGSPHLVHLWNYRTGVLEHSLYPLPEHAEELEGAYAFTGFASIAVRGDEIAVLFSLGSSLDVYGRDGTLRRRIRIPYQHFRRLSEPLPAQGSPAEFARWNESYSTASQVFWTVDGGRESFWIQYFDTEGAELKWRLLRMDGTGMRIFDRLDTPRLLSASDDGSVLVFERPDGSAPNEWRLAAPIR